MRWNSKAANLVVRNGQRPFHPANVVTVLAKRSVLQIGLCWNSPVSCRTASEKQMHDAKVSPFWQDLLVAAQHMELTGPKSQILTRPRAAPFRFKRCSSRAAR